MLRWKTRAFWREVGRVGGAFLTVGLVLVAAPRVVTTLGSQVQSFEYPFRWFSTSALIAIGFTLAVIVFSRKTALGSLKQQSRLSRSAYLLGPLAVIFINGSITFFLESFYYHDRGNSGIVQQLFSDSSTMIATYGILTVGVIGPFAEELFFRGFLMEAVNRWGRRSLAIVISAAIFGLIHFDLVQFVGGFPMGLTLGVLTFASGSLWPAVVSHVVNNSMALLLSDLDFGLIEALIGDAEGMTRSIFFAGFGLLFAFVALASTAAAVGGFGALRVAFTGAEPEPAAESPTSQTAESAEMT